MRLYRLFVISCALLGGVSAAAGEPFHIQAHRGGGIALPENTLETFRWSWERGVTPEADLRTIKNGVIVCFHDANFKRVLRNANEAQKAAAVETLKLADIQKVDVGAFRGSKYAGQRVPTLASVFTEMQGHPDRLLYIDVKKVDLDALARLVRQHGVQKQVIFTTSDYNLIRDWKKRVPESMTLLWNGGDERALAKRLDSVRKEEFEGITHLQIHVKAGDLDTNDADPFIPRSQFIKSLGDELADRGIVFQVLPWECSDQRAYERLLALGVDSFATDYPEVTLNAVRSFREEQSGKGVGTHLPRIKRTAP